MILEQLAVRSSLEGKVKQGTKASYQEGFDHAIQGRIEAARLSTDPAYLEGAAAGMLNKDSPAGVSDSRKERREPPTEIQLDCFLRSCEKGRPAIRPHIRRGRPDLSDIEGTTGLEDQHSLH